MQQRQTMARVLQVMAGNDHDGAESHFFSLTAALQKAGIEQHTVIYKNKQRAEFLRDSGVKTLELPDERFFGKVNRVLLSKEIADYKPDIVQSWMYHSTRITPSGNHLHVGWLRGYHHLQDYKRCDYLIGITKGIVMSVIERGWPAERIRNIRPFADDSPTFPMERAKYNTPPDVPLLLVLGRLHWHKALDTLLLAMAQLQQYNAYLWIAGDGDERKKLEKFAADIGVADRVRFLGWQYNIPALYAACDMVVLPSRYEPFGLVMIEAWAHKRPLVSTNAAGPRATAQNELDALLVQVDDVDALVQAIIRVLKEPELREKLVKYGYAHFERDYTLSSTVAQYKQFYSEILQRGPQVNRGLSYLTSFRDRLLAPFRNDI
jgi:glycosyltransferase involved in cell wall biosynthesis